MRHPIPNTTVSIAVASNGTGGRGASHSVIRDKRVLVVEDDTDTRELLAAILDAEGAVVETAPSASEGMEALQRFQPHILVSDVGMPGEDGYAFLRRVRRLPPQQGGCIPALALTAFSAPGECTRAIEAGFTAYLAKPVSAEGIASAVADLIRGFGSP